jgi:hypothetical protein
VIRKKIDEARRNGICSFHYQCSNERKHTMGGQATIQADTFPALGQVNKHTKKLVKWLLWELDTIAANFFCLFICFVFVYDDYGDDGCSWFCY